MEERMTVEQVIGIVIGTLSGIRVPAELTEEIGIPVLRSIQNLRECLRAYEQSAAEQAKAAKDEAERPAVTEEEI
jgi:small basic protein